MRSLPCSFTFRIRSYDCQAAVCVDLTLLSMHASHINWTEFWQAVGEDALWVGGVLIAVAAMLAVIGVADDPITSWSAPRLFGVAMIGIGALLLGLPSVIGKFIQALGGDADAFSQVFSFLTTAGVAIMGIGGLIAISGSIYEVVVGGWNIIKTLTDVGSPITFIGSAIKLGTD
jgi:hypothetical protein